MQYLVKIMAKIENENKYLPIHRKEYFLDICEKTYPLPKSMSYFANEQLRDVLEECVQYRAEQTYQLAGDNTYLCSNFEQGKYLGFIDFLINTAVKYPYGYIDIKVGE